MCDNKKILNELIGKTISFIELKEEKEEIVGFSDSADSETEDDTYEITELHPHIVSFVTNENEVYLFYHDQDCCESVYLVDICGDLEDLLHTPILQATEECNSKLPDEGRYCDVTHTWSFYRFTTIKGTVVFRWFGGSSGYYSERIQIERVISDKKRVM